MSSWLRAAALAAMAFACLPGEARADGGAAQYRYVPACDGSYGPLNASGPSTLTYDLHGQLCTVGTAGGGGTAATPFAPAGVYSLLSVSATTSNVSLPAGSTVVVYNNGATDAFVHLGSSSGVTATVNQDVVKSGQSVAFAVGTNTFLAAITASSTTTLTLSGGSGIFTGVGGGGSGGGGGGVVTQGTIPWVSSITSWAGSTLGAITTYGTAPAGIVPGVNAFVTNTLNAAITNASIAVTQGTSPWVTSVTSFTTWAGGTLGAMANYGTSPGPVLVPGVNAFVTNSLTVTANAGTNLNTTALALDASVGTTNVDIGPPGATVCASDTGSCSINALLQRIAARLSTLIGGGVVTQGTTPWVDSITTWAGSTLGAISNYGTSPGAVLVPAVNAFVTNAATIGVSPAFQPGNAYAALSVTTTTANVALPAGTTVVVYNTGANDAFVHLGTSGAVTATVSHDVLKAGQSVAYIVGTNTFIAAITGAGTTTLTASGGSGGFAGVGGGGSGGGGGGAVTQATIPWVDNITQWAGTTLGAISNYGTSPGAVAVPAVNAFVTNSLTITANAGSNLNTSALALDTSVGTTNTDLGAPGATACATDTGSCNHNALLQRIAQRLSTLIATGGTAFSIVDSAAWTAGTSPFVPSGGEFNAGATALTTGQQGTIALAANRHQLTLEDNSAAILSAMSSAIPAGTNIIGKVGIDQTTPGTTNGVQIAAAIPTGTNNIGTVSGSNVGGYDANPATTPTVQASAYALGNCMGGFQTVSLARTSGGAGILNKFSLISTGGGTTGLQVYIFDSNPSGSTCTDKSTFTIVAADQSKLLTTFLLIPAAPIGVTWTEAEQSGIGAPFVTSGNTNVYVALVSTGAWTPASTTDLKFRVGASLD